MSVTRTEASYRRWKRRRDLLRYWRRRLIAPAAPWLLRGGFRFRGESYPYAVFNYNTTWDNERAVEIPVMQRLLQGARGRILEVGNVLSHYGPITHTVVDKYERAPDVINVDIENFVAEPFDLIVTISTLEHVGWNRREPKAPERLLGVWNHLQSLLTEGGRLVATVPQGYNPWLDAQLAAGTLPVDSVEYLWRRRRYEWVETDFAAIKDVRYDAPYASGNVVAVLTKTRDGAAPV